MGVTSLIGIKLVIFLAELNDLESWGTCISNAYLEIFTKEKVFIVAVPEFGPLEAHNLIIVKLCTGFELLVCADVKG